MFRGKSSCSNFSLLTEPLADLINKAMTITHLSCLSNTLRYIDLHDKQTILDKSIPFTDPPALLFNIPTSNNKYVKIIIRVLYKVENNYI